MGVFAVLLLVPILSQLFVVGEHEIDYEKKNQRALAFFFFFLTILVMFRHESVGNDTGNYIWMFEKFAKSDWKSLAGQTAEIGYALFCKLVSLLSKEPHFFLAAAALIVNVMIYPTYKRLCLDASLTIVLFCIMSTFVMMFSGIRQMLAIGVGFIAYDFTRHKKIIPFALAVCLAMSFHTSAFMLAFMYPAYHAKIKKNWLYVIVPVLVLVFVFNKPIFSFLTMIIEQHTRFAGGVTSTGAYTMLLLLVIFAVFSFVIPDETLLDEETIGLRNFLLLALAVQLFAPLHYLAMRMNYYYIIFIPLLLPKIIACSSARWEQIAVLGRYIMLAFFLVYFFVNAQGGGGLNVFPYHFFWE